MGEQKQGWQEQGGQRLGDPGGQWTPCGKKGPRETREQFLCSEDLFSRWDGGEEVTH